MAEAADAIATAGGRATAAVCEELGDVLMNVFLAARIAQETSDYDLAAVAAKISDKLIRRHPHVFGDETAETVDDVLRTWLKVKETEAKAKTGGGESAGSRLDRVPRSLPALTRAHELARAAAKVGFDWPDPRGAFEKVREELDELEECLRESAPARGSAVSPLETEGDGAAGQSVGARVEEELGDLMLAVANLCRKAGVHPERALRGANAKFERRFRAIEGSIEKLEEPTLAEMEALWQAEKERETAGTVRSDATGGDLTGDQEP